MSDGEVDDEERGPGIPTARRIARIVLAAGLVALIALALLRIFITPVSPAQDPPERHPALTCAVCHIVSDSIDEVEVP